MKSLNEFLGDNLFPMQDQFNFVMDELDNDEMVCFDVPPPTGELIKRVRQAIAKEHGIPFYKQVAVGAYRTNPPRVTVNPKHLWKAKPVKHLSRRQKAAVLKAFKQQERAEKEKALRVRIASKEAFEQKIIDEINKNKSAGKH
jgi:hypothetical protein